MSGRGTARVARSVLAGGVLALTGAGLWAGSSAAAAAGGAAVVDGGWWTSRPGAAANADGSLEVGRTPEGIQSLAAVHVSVPAGSAPVTLTLGTTNGQTTHVLWVCRTSSAFTATQAGAMAAAPTYGCAGHVVLSATATGFRADITSLVRPGVTGLAIVAQPDAGSLLPLPYTYVFHAQASSPTPATTTTSPPTTPTTAFPPPTSPPTTAPTAPATTLPPATTVPPPPTTAPADNTFGPPLGVNTGDAPSGEGKPWGRLLVLVPLCGLAGVGSVYGRRIVASRGLLAP